MTKKLAWEATQLLVHDDGLYYFIDIDTVNIKCGLIYNEDIMVFSIKQ